jgi:hypothetical protein
MFLVFVASSSFIVTQLINSVLNLYSKAACFNLDINNVSSNIEKLYLPVPDEEFDGRA